MRAKKLIALLIIPLLFGLCTNTTLAWFNTPVQTSTLYMAGEPVAKLGTTTQYGYDAPAKDTFPHFYSALIADGCGAMGMLWYPELVKIEVSGTDPNGNPLSGDRFGDREVLVSPDDSGVEQQILKTIYDVLMSAIPYGLGAIVKNTVSAGGGTTDKDGTKAWGKWQRPVWGLAREERGLRFRYALVVDPTLEGTYTINIHYHAWICAYDGVKSYHAGYIDLYDTVYYTYQTAPPPAPPYIPSHPSGTTSGYTGITYTFYASTTDPNGDDVRYEFDWDISSTIEIPVSEDSYVDSYSPSTNYGSDPLICAGWGEIFGNYISTDGWLKFSLSSIPSGVYITDAKLWLYGHPTTDWWAGVCFSSDDSWSESTITWNNEPNFGGIIDYFLITVTPENNYGMMYWGWNVTPTVKSEYTGDKTVSFVMVAVYLYNGGFFSSKENSDGNAPYLEVTFQEEPPQPPTGWYPPGITASASHSWSSPGTYNVKVRAQDVGGLWSDWSQPLTVNIRNPYLTVLAEDLNGTSLTAGYVYIDDQYRGRTGSTFTVETGTHKVFVSNFWESRGSAYWCSFQYWKDGPTDNPRNMLVDKDKTITARFKKTWCTPVNDNPSFEQRDLNVPGPGVLSCPPWDTNMPGWRECRGDVAGPGGPPDGKVTLADILTVSAQGVYGSQYGDPGYKVEYDVAKPGGWGTDGKISLVDILFMSKEYGRTANRTDGVYSWFANGTLLCNVWQWLDSDALQAVAGHTVVFSFWFYPRSSSCYAYARIYYEYSGGSNIESGMLISSTDFDWWNAYVTVTLPSDITKVQIVTYGIGGPFNANIDLAKLCVIQ